VGNKLLGLPLVMWAGVCLVMALIWVRIWPSDRIAVDSGLRFIVLRWFHALTWLLLAIAALVAAFSPAGVTKEASRIALLALVVYLMFMAAFITAMFSGKPVLEQGAVC